MDPDTLIRENKIDEFLREYQLGSFTFDRAMLLLALQYRHFKIAEIIFKSGLGCLKYEVYFNTFPDDIKEMIENYEEILEKEDLPMDDYRNIQYKLIDMENSAHHKLNWLNKIIDAKILNSLYELRPPKTFKQISINSINRLLSGKNTVYGKMSFYKFMYISWGFDYGDKDEKDIHPIDLLSVEDTRLPELLASYDVAYDIDKKCICVRHLLPPIINVIPNCHCDDVDDDDNDIICKKHNNYTYKDIKKYNEKYFNNGVIVDFIYDFMSSTMPKYRNEYMALYIYLDQTGI